MLLVVTLAGRAAAGPTAWLDGGAAPADAPVRLTLALKQRNLAELERRFRGVAQLSPLASQAVCNVSLGTL